MEKQIEKKKYEFNMNNWVRITWTTKIHWSVCDSRQLGFAIRARFGSSDWVESIPVGFGSSRVQVSPVDVALAAVDVSDEVAC